MSSELNGNKERLGPAGRLAALFQGSAITPLLALVGLLLGLFAVLVTPEEEPQIDVTFADVYIPFRSHPGRGGISRYHPCRAGGLPDQGY